MTSSAIQLSSRAALRALFCMLFCLANGAADATASTPTPHNRLIAIDIDTDARDGDEDAGGISLRFEHPVDVSDIRAFSTLTPPRLVLDLPRAKADVGLPRSLPGHGLLKQADLAADDTRLRLQLELRRGASHRLATEGKTLRVTLQEQPAAVASIDSARLQAIDFQRGTAGEARLTLELPSAQTSVRLRQLGQRLVADIGAALPAALRRRTDVSDFATPVMQYAAMPHEGGTRLVIEPQGLWRYHAYQRDRHLMIDVIPVTAPPSGLPLARTTARVQGALHPGDTLSLNFSDIDVRAALQLLADFSGQNLVAADSVTGKLSLRLQDVHWEQALEVILQARGLGMRRNGDVLWIAPHSDMLARERQELEQKTAIAELEPLQAEVFQLSYQRADTFRRVFGIGDDGAVQPGRRNALLSKRGSAVVDARTNQLFVTDTLAVLGNIRTLLKRIDIAARQVLIEARIVEADDSFSRNLGVRLGLSARTGGAAFSGTHAGAAALSGQLQAADGAAPPPSPSIDLPAQGSGGSAPGSFALTLFNAAAHRFLNIELSALETDGRGKIVASPRVVTGDQQAALIEQGEEIPYQQSTSSGATSVAFKKANLKLEVTPQITPDGHVILDVDVNKDSRGNATPGGLAINTKHVKTKVQVEDGGTVVIGGIYTQTEGEHEARVPLLGEIPLLGGLFRHRARVQEKTELLIFLTPRVVGTPDVR